MLALPGTSPDQSLEEWKIVRAKGIDAHIDTEYILNQSSRLKNYWEMETKKHFIEIKREVKSSRGTNLKEVGIIRIGPYSKVKLEKPYPADLTVLTVERDINEIEDPDNDPMVKYAGCCYSFNSLGHANTKSGIGQAVLMKPFDPPKNFPKKFMDKIFHVYFSVLGETKIFTYNRAGKRVRLALLDSGEKITLFNPYAPEPLTDGPAPNPIHMLFQPITKSFENGFDTNDDDEECEFETGFRFSKIRFNDLDEIGPFLNDPYWQDIEPQNLWTP